MWLLWNIFRKRAYHRPGSRLPLVEEISLAVVPLCSSLLNPDLFVFVVLHFQRDVLF